MPTDCNLQTKLEKERVSLADFLSVLEGYKSDARGIIPTSYHNIINICYFMKTLLHRVNTWKSAKNIPPLFYFQEQRIGDLPSRTTRFYENTSSRRAMKQKMNTYFGRVWVCRNSSFTKHNNIKKYPITLYFDSTFLQNVINTLYT